MNEQEEGLLRKWFSVGDLLTLLGMLVALGVVFGSLSKDVESLKADIAALKEQRISPGAEVALSEIRAKDNAQDEQIRALREELRDQRREILEAINRLDDQLNERRSK